MRLSAPLPLAPGGRPQRGLGALFKAGALTPLRGTGAERGGRCGMTPSPRRSLQPQLWQPPRRRPEATGKVSGFGGDEERTRRGRGGASPAPGSARLASLRAPPSSSRPRPHLPGLLGLGFPGASPWTSGSPPRDSVLPFRSPPPLPPAVAGRGPRGGEARRGSPRLEVGAQPRGRGACSRVPPGPWETTWTAPKGPFKSPQREATGW